MRVLSVTSEVFPLVKTGGLADVTGALPIALAAEGVQVRTLLPGYPAVMRGLSEAGGEAGGEAKEVLAFFDLFGGPARVLAARCAGLDLLVLQAPHLFDRAGGPYVGPEGRDWADNPFRFAALSWAAAAIGRGAVSDWSPGVVHMHDWQAGLTAAYLHYGEAPSAGRPRPGTLITVHNLAFSGWCPGHLLADLRLPPEAWSIDGVEFYGGIGALKAGLRLSDRITTVSPTYAAEIQRPEDGWGLDGLLRTRADDLRGILNGIDLGIWDPATDRELPARFDAAHLLEREGNRAALRAAMGLAEDTGAPVLGVVSRLTGQKGMDLLLEALPSLMRHGMQLALLGSGEPELERGFREAATAHPGRIGVRIGYDEALAHLIQAGCDALLVPSRFEPCGLTQLCALRYGALPVVARVGGLADTVIDANEVALAAGVATGLQFSPTTRPALEAALVRLAALWKDREAWRRTQGNAMGTEVGWSASARRYAQIYAEIAPPA